MRDYRLFTGLCKANPLDFLATCKVLALTTAAEWIPFYERYEKLDLSANIQNQYNSATSRERSECQHIFNAKSAN